MNTSVPSLKGWRTLAVNIVMALLPVLEMSEMLNILPKEWHPHYAIFVSAVNMYMRTITNTSIGAKA